MIEVKIHTPPNVVETTAADLAIGDVFVGRLRVDDAGMERVLLRIRDGMVDLLSPSETWDRRGRDLSEIALTGNHADAQLDVQVRR